jgi:N-acetylneuraminic acid mutarotase
LSNLFAPFLDITWGNDNITAAGSGEPGVSINQFNPIYALVSGNVSIDSTSDGGNSWALHGPPNPHNYGDVVNGWLADSPGHALETALNPALDGADLTCAQSTDFGVTWSDFTQCSSSIDTIYFDDREYIWVDNSPSSAFHGRIYVTEALLDSGGSGNFNTVTVRWSSDNGNSWNPPRNQPIALVPSNEFALGLNHNEFPSAGISPDGTVGYVWHRGMCCGGPTPINSPNKVMFTRSTDGGVTWPYSTTIVTVPLNRSVPWGAFSPFGPRWSDSPNIAADPSSNGVYYVTWTAYRTPSTPSSAAIYLSKTTDNGNTWSAPTIPYNNPNANIFQGFGWVKVTADGTVHVTYFGGTTSNTQGGQFYVQSTDGGASWSAPFQLNSTSITSFAAQTDYIANDATTSLGSGGIIAGIEENNGHHARMGTFLAGTPTPTPTGTLPTATPTNTPTDTPTSTPTVCGVPAWQQGPTMTPGRWAIEGTVGADGKVYVATGLNIASTPLPAQMARYDPNTDSWSDVAPPLVADGYYSMAAEGGKVYVAGGFLGGSGITNTLQIYDIATNSWSLGAPMPISLEGAAGVALNGKFYVVGGDDYFNTSFRSTYIYDISSNTWTTGHLIPDPYGRTNTYGTTAGGLVYVWGGSTYPGFVNIDTLIAYDPGTNTWTTLASANTGGLGNLGAVSPYGTGKLFVTDGGDNNLIASSTTHIYDIASNTWTSGPTMLEARLGHAQVTLPDGRVFVYGGLGFSGTNTTAEFLSVLPCNTPTNTPTLEVPTDTATATALQATATLTATAMATACTLAFSDVPRGSTFYLYVHCLACVGIINGYSDGTFKPNNNVTRGQLSKIVSNSAGLSDNQPNQMFEDVPVGSTFQVFIGRLASRGYIGGYPCGGPGEPCISPGNLPYFRPNNSATRGQITKIDANAAGYNDTPTGQHFEDVAPGSAFYTYTYRLATRSIMGGYPCGGVGEPCNPPGNLPYFRPNNNATRGQTSKIVSNTFFPDCNPPDTVKQ